METYKNKILVPFDFSNQSLIALEQSCNIAQMLNAEIYILYVINKNKLLFNKKEQYDFEEKLKIKLTEYTDLIEKKSGIKIISLIEKGNYLKSIIKIVKQLKINFLIIGITNFFDNIYQIINKVSFPVIIIKGEQNINYKNIVLPLDLTKETREKISNAINFAKHFKSIIHIVTVNTTNDVYIIDRLKMQLEQVSNYIKNQGIECTQNFINSDFNDDKNVCNTLLNFSHKINADLIMIMTHQETDFIDLLGSLAKEIINNSDIPIMSIVPKKFKKN